jgi:hypothetical protein
MYLDKLESLLTNLRKANIFGFRQDGKIYNTNHNGLNVDMSHYDLSMYSNEYMLIKFKDKSNNEIFTLNYTKNINLYGDLTKENPSLIMLINNLELKDKNVIDSLLKKVDFDSFLNKEIINSENAYQKIIEQVEEGKKNQKIAEQNFTNDLISKFNDINYTSTTSLNQVKNLINSINDSEIKDFFVDKNLGENFTTIDKNSTLEKEYVEDFKEFTVTYKKISYFLDDLKDDGAEISFINKEKNINFEIIFDKTDYSAFITSKPNKYEYLHIKIGEQNITDNELVTEILNKSGATEYLHSLCEKVNKLHLSQIAQQDLSAAISKNFTSIKAQNLLNQLSNNEINDVSNPNPISFEINGCKVWVNDHGKLHREDGPAIENYHGGYFWFKNGKAYIPNEKSEIYFYNCQFSPKEAELLIKDIPGSFTIVGNSVNNEIQQNIEERNNHHKVVSNLVNKFRKMFSSEDKNNKPKI